MKSFDWWEDIVSDHIGSSTTTYVQLINSNNIQLFHAKLTACKNVNIVLFSTVKV